MKFLDLVDSNDNFIGEIVQFDDDVCVLKFSIIRKVFCFDNYPKLIHYILTILRLRDVKLIKNGIMDKNDIIDDNDEDSEDEN